ncbi:MAG: histidine phosphatase family protein, partial [Candidatus Eisenbacteria bacterium]
GAIPACGGRRRVNETGATTGTLRLQRDGERTRIHLVRHGEVDNPARIYYGRLDGFPLSQTGVRQAQAAARVLGREPLAAIFSSPLLRTRQTAACIAAEHPELKVMLSDLLIEVCTPYEGRTFKEISGTPGDAYTGTVAPHEQPDEILARMRRFVAEVRTQYRGRTVAAVTHGDTIAFLWLWARDLPTSGRMELYREHLGKGSITTLTYATDSADERPAVHDLAAGGEQPGAPGVSHIDGKP